jgi:ComF family protein
MAGDQRSTCGECLSTPPHFDQTIVATDYSAPFDQLVLALKFGHRLPLATLFSDLLRDAILRQAEQDLPQILCPVPLGAQRLRERGFNQSLEIAKPLASQLGITLQSALLRRVRDTVQQSGLHPDARQKNIRNAFTLNDTAIELVQGKHIGLIDDVMTTGTTLNEIAALLKRFGAAKVSNYVFARTARH